MPGSKKLRFTLTLLVLACLGPPATAVPVVEGEGLKSWENSAVVVGSVREVSLTETGATVAKVKLLAVLSTQFVIPTELELTYTNSAAGTIRALEKDKTYLILIFQMAGKWALLHVKADFMDGNGPVLEVSGVDDKKVGEINERIRRLKGIEEIRLIDTTPRNPTTLPSLKRKPATRPLD